MANYKEMAVPPNQEKITVEQIPPSYTSNTLAAFLFQQTGKDSFQRPDGLSLYYPEIFTSLRKMAFPQQERLLVSFFTEKVEGFPNGEELGKELAKINNIHWFRPNQEPEQGVLKQLSRTCLQRLKYPSRPSTPLKIIRENWGEVLDATKNVWYVTPWVPRGVAMGSRGVAGGAAYSVARVTTQPARRVALDLAFYMARAAAQESAWEAAWETTRTPARDAAWGVTWYRRYSPSDAGYGDATWKAQWEAVFEKAWGPPLGEARRGGLATQDMPKDTFKNEPWYANWEAAYEATKDVAWDMIQDATWIVVKDLMPARGYSKGNPLEPIMEIYKLGYWPIGPVINKETGIREFVVFVPPVVSPTGNR